MISSDIPLFAEGRVPKCVWSAARKLCGICGLSILQIVCSLLSCLHLFPKYSTVFFLWSTNIIHLQQTNVFFWSSSLFLTFVVALKPVASSLAHEANHDLCGHGPAHSWQFISVEFQPNITDIFSTCGTLRLLHLYSVHISEMVRTLHMLAIQIVR